MAKRGNGEGSIFKRANGRWYSALTYRDDCGEMKRREVSGRTPTPNDGGHERTRTRRTPCLIHSDRETCWPATRCC